ncbi:D-alanine--D-alanine ligase family protein [Intrasporangium sp.]|uniref:D-alanine--D-alanine ligase family protein n=1 Tax=Intrasporangium sp. TaxID=1925024 RepID=UPI00293B66D2|nr:D-alanine--D-alanine ligase family protein [Intrasporangium sp.]MDV3222006.1 D-alanine--D-alanine ligase [Intrasporangium sp.]
MRVGVIHGGISSEYDVSVASGQGIIESLRRIGHEPVPILIGPSGAWLAPTGRGRSEAIGALLTCDVVVPALHGVQGEDGTVQGLLEMLGLPYVGSGVRASALCLDKDLTKTIVSRAGVPVAPGVAFDAARVRRAIGSERERSALLLELSHAGVQLPLFVKPVHGGSSIGVSRITDRADLPGALRAAGDGSVVIEAEVVGLEVDLPVLELPDGSLRCGPSLLIDSDPREPFFTEAAKYASEATRFTIPAPIPPATARTLEELALTAFAGLGCRGLARIDFFVTADGPVLGEVNTFPGFTAQSQFPRMWAAAGISYDDLVDTLLQTALASSRSTPVHA